MNSGDPGSEPAPGQPAGLSFEDLLSGKRDTPDKAGEADDKNPANAAMVMPPPGDVALDPAAGQIVANIRRELTHQFRASEVNVLEAGNSVRASGNVGSLTYLPDVVVDGGEPDRAARQARQPRVIFEVAAEGSERAAFIGSWAIHEKVPGVDVHALVDPARMSVLVRHRQKDGTWREEPLTDPDETVYLPTIHGLLTLETIYQDAMSGGDEGRV